MGCYPVFRDGDRPHNADFRKSPFDIVLVTDQWIGIYFMTVDVCERFAKMDNVRLIIIQCPVESIRILEKWNEAVFY